MSSHPKRSVAPGGPALLANDWKKRVEALLKSAHDEGLTAEQVMARLQELAPAPFAPSDLPTIISERTTRGYKVRRSAPLLTEEDRNARQAITVQAMAQALKELRH
jgi:hypothetical protein